MNLDEILNDVWPGEKKSTAYSKLINLLLKLQELTGKPVKDLVHALDRKINEEKGVPQ